MTSSLCGEETCLEVLWELLASRMAPISYAKEESVVKAGDGAR